MLNKFMFLVGHSLKKKFKSKAFIIANIIIFLVILAIANINSIISAFGGDFTKESNIYIVDNSGYNSAEIFDSAFAATSETLGVKLDNKIELSSKDYDTLVSEIEDTNNIIIVLNQDDENYISAKITSVAYIDTVLYQVIYQSLSATKYSVAIENSNIDQEELIKISSPIATERILLDETKKSDAESMEMIMTVVFPTLILPFYLLIIMLVQLIGGEINEEKQSRSMEVIISNVTPKTHFFSKIISSNIFIITQSVLLFIYGFIGLVVKSFVGTPKADLTGGVAESVNGILDSLKTSGFMDKLSYVIPLAIVLMILSFLAYSLVAGILASMTVSIEDYQQIQTPIMLISVAGYMLAIMSGSFQGSALIKFFSYVPFISCMLSPALLIIGQTSIIDFFISIIILVIVNIGLIKYGIKIYKIGILNYSTDKMWKRIFNAAKVKN